MSRKWKKAFRGVEAVQAFESLDRGGHQRPDPRYNTPNRVGPPDEGPLPSVQDQIPRYGQNASYFNGHPHSNVSSPFGVNATQAPGPFQYSYQSSPPPQPLQHAPQSSPPQQYSPPVADYSYSQNQSAYGAHQGTTTTNYHAPVQGSPPQMENYNASGNPPRWQNRGFEDVSGGNSRIWSSPGTQYDSYNQPRTEYSQRSNTIYEGSYQQQYDTWPEPLHRSSTMPNNNYHNCAENLSQ
ncbi:hypothetical protein P171DRAFT_487252 [Karstenula rhodostoma CBS 690.94]|uniref:Uncharacterized protein n=1 Tax=Karstenula rhodostoma CBS 690.94 TaxID=1392251 RepID=A0A9P4PEQ7_9PLEO|nr:hypothetical protein P171DRAFT_487252 [Karstenula rhodostoma CBS 690.94]